MDPYVVKQIEEVAVLIHGLYKTIHVFRHKIGLVALPFEGDLSDASVSSYRPITYT